MAVNSQLGRRLARLEATSSGMTLAPGASGLVAAAESQPLRTDLFQDAGKELKGVRRLLLQAALWDHPHRDAILALPGQERRQRLAPMYAAYEQRGEWDGSLVSWDSDKAVHQGEAEARL